MSKVDVLGVLDRAILSCPNADIVRAINGREGSARDLIAARAAVAELIEAANNHLTAYGAGYDASERIGASMDLRAALANIGSTK